MNRCPKKKQVLCDASGKKCIVYCPTNRSDSVNLAKNWSRGGAQAFTNVGVSRSGQATTTGGAVCITSEGQSIPCGGGS